MHLLSIALRQLLLLVHVMAFAFAIVTVLRANAALLAARDLDARKLARTEYELVRLLVVLWCTGLALVPFEIGLDLRALAARPVLAAKLCVVALLTAIGVAMHVAAIPRLTQRQRARRRAATVCTTLGAVGTVTWLFAAFLGTARWIAAALNFRDLMLLYGMALATGWVIALELVQPRIERLMKRQEPHAKIERALFAVIGRSAALLIDAPTRQAHASRPWAYAHALAARIPDTMAADRRVFLARVQPLLQPRRDAG